MSGICSLTLSQALAPNGTSGFSTRDSAAESAGIIPMTSLAPHERLPEILVVPREKTPTGAARLGAELELRRSGSSLGPAQ